MDVTVILDSRSPALAGGLTYEAHEDVRPGDLVRVPLRRGVADGIVWDAVAAPSSRSEMRLKAVQEVVERSFVSPSLLAIARSFCARFAVTPRQALGTVLPPPPWSALATTETVFQATERSDDPRGDKQRKALALLRTSASGLTEEDLRTLSGASLATIRSLVGGGWVLAQRASPAEHIVSPGTTTVRIVRGGERLARRTTAVEAIEACLAGGRRIIVLAADLDRAREWEGLLAHRRTAVLHSDDARQRSRWKNIFKRGADVIIGTRAAIFAPISPLGLVVIEDEEDWAYKSERSPRFHARDVAQERCLREGGALLLLSACPSSETWLREQRSTATCTVLPAPERMTVMIDAATAAWGNHYPLSPPLLHAVRERAARGEQCALFFNRRGIATGMLCLRCRRRLLSSSTGLPLVLHRSAQGVPELVDHATGHRSPMPSLCPSCGSAELRPVGAGTARLEDLLRTLVPEAGIARLDAESEMRDATHAQIVVGTQSMLRSGILERASLAAVVLADIGLSVPHFRAGERVVHTLARIRDAIAPSCLFMVQTFRPEAPELSWLRSGDPSGYFERELSERDRLGYPPVLPLTHIETRGKPATEIAGALQRRAQELGIDARVTIAKTASGDNLVAVRTTKIDALLRGADLRDATVDRDPLW